MDGVPEKKCSKCGEVKPVNQYAIEGRTYDGLRAQCKSCQSEVRKAYYARNSDRIKAGVKRYQSENADKIKAKNLAWYQKNRERSAQESLAWRTANKQKVNEAAAEYRARKRDYIRDWLRSFRKENPGYGAEHRRNRRALTRGARGLHTGADTARIRGLQKGKCACCRSLLAKTGAHVDHIVPLARGGMNTADNLQLLCPACNMKKSAKDPIQWANENGLLI